MLKENLLFCGGYNAGIRLAIERNYEYVMIVNADTEVVNPGFVTSLIEAMERHSADCIYRPACVLPQN